MTSIRAPGASPQPSTAPDPLREASRQLEAVFLQSLFDEMAKTVEKSDLFPKAPGGDMYEQWFRREVAADFSKSGGVGLSDMVYEQLSSTPGKGENLNGIHQTSQMAMQGGTPFEDPVSGFVPTGRDPAPVQVRGGGAVAPAQGPVTSPFGPRQHPVTGNFGEHRGVDVAVPVGSAVRSPFSGTVVEVGEHPLLGRYVKVEHKNGYRSLFAHLSSAEVQVGQQVGAASVVARSGNTGRSTGPHLHYGLYQNGEPTDPARFIPALRSQRPTKPGH